MTTKMDEESANARPWHIAEGNRIPLVLIKREAAIVAYEQHTTHQKMPKIAESSPVLQCRFH